MDNSYELCYSNSVIEVSIILIHLINVGTLIISQKYLLGKNKKLYLEKKFDKSIFLCIKYAFIYSTNMNALNI